MAKTSSKGSSKKKKGNKRNKLNAPESVAMKAKAPKENMFESIWSRRKFDILGRKRKDEERRRVGLSRSLAIQKRQKTLLKEYEGSTKSSVFVDKRIGEQNDGLEEFDKAILRSQREQQLKLKKKSMYNLSDGEGDNDDDFFAGRDDFDEEPLDEDDLNASEKNTTFGLLDPREVEDGLRSLEGQENRHKSKKEVMEDIIFKSKFFKAQKAKEKEENEEFIEQLDKDFAALERLEPEKLKALKSGVNNRISSDNAKKDELYKISSQQEKPDDYDKLMGQMIHEMRARPSDRTKTPEELAQEEKERLEELEKERLKRMNAADDSDNENDDTSEDEEKSGKRPRHISGDDLGDSFSDDVNSKTKMDLIGKILAQENESDSDDSASSEESENEDEDEDEDNSDDEEGSDEEHSNDRKAQSLKDWEQSDDEDIDTSLEDQEDEASGDDNEVAIGDNGLDKKKSKDPKKDSSGAGKVKTTTHEELHYKIEAPKTFEELSALLENRSDEEIVEAIKRIRSYNAILVAAENRKKIQVFYGLLLQYFAVLANKKPLNLKLLNLLVKPLMEISTEIPYFAAICARQRLLRIRTQFCEDVRNAGKSCWPSMKTLLLWRLWSMIFPCSDFRHAVMTPAMLLISEYLMRCPITSGRDIAIGSFLCSLVLSISKQSQKFCPEVITFIQTMLLAALKNRQGNEDSQLYHLMEVKSLKPLLRMQGRVENINPLDFLVLMDLPDDSPYFSSDNFRASLLFTIIGTLKGFANIYDGFKSFPEIFLPIRKVLVELAEDHLLPDALKVEINDVANHIENKSQEHHLLRQPLRMKKQKIIKTAVPKFEEGYVKGRDYDPDRERAEMKKLKKQYKQEAKGAVRELRKDNYFIAEVKQREKARLVEDKNEQYGKHRAFLQEQEHAYKSGQLGKGKGKKRRR